jgi:lipoate-protein ligase A
MLFVFKKSGTRVDLTSMAKKVEIGTGVWRLVITPPLHGYLNMAVDELFLTEARNGERPPTLRFYQWEGDWISFGYFQTPQKAFNLEEAEKSGVCSVRRLTGGRAVLHSEDLTYALVAGDAQKEGLGSSLKETYRQIACALTSGFTRLGLPVAFSFREKPPARQATEGPAACFLTLSDYEISAGGKKLVGSAQRREGSSFLQHGSIPLTIRNRQLAERVLTRKAPSVPPGIGAGSSFGSRYATVEEVAGRKIPVEDLSAALKKGFGEVFGVEFEEEEFSSEQLAEAHRRAEQYALPGWNERKAGSADFGRAEAAPAEAVYDRKKS